MAELGHEVDLVTYHLGQNVNIPNVVVHRTPKLAFIKTISVGPSLKKLLLDAFMMMTAVRILRTRRFDLLHTHEEASFFGALLARLFKVPHLYDMHSSLPQQLLNFKYTRFAPLVRVFDWLERTVINSSSALITICPALEEHARKINESIPHVMIENVASEPDCISVREQDVERFRSLHGAADRKIVFYAGTFEPYQGIDLLVNSAEYVVRARQDVLFMMMGGKPGQAKHYLDIVRDRGLEAYFSFMGIRPPEEIPTALKAADVLVSPRTSGTNTPLKIYAYLRAGKPIVATRLYTHTQVLNADVAVLVDPTPEALASGVLSVLQDRELAEGLGRQARKLFEVHYNFDRYLQKTRDILQMAVARR